MLEVYQMNFEATYLQEAILRGKQILEFFADQEQGGCYLTASDAENLIVRPKEVYDGAIPSGNSVAAVLFGRLSEYTGEIVWQEISERQNCFLAGIMGQHPFGYSFGLIALTEALYPSVELICVTSGQEIPCELDQWMKNGLNPNCFVILKTKDNTEILAKLAPFTRSYPIPKKDSLYYVCENGTCKVPEQNIRKLF